ncbi:DUF2945 domain-containing protein [Streptomyces sp. NPDC001493]
MGSADPGGGDDANTCRLSCRGRRVRSRGHGEGRKLLSQGDDVSWKSHGQDVEGSVKRGIDQRAEAAGGTVESSEGRPPQHEVRSDETGRSRCTARNHCASEAAAASEHLR